MMMIDENKLVDAGDITADGVKKYRVVYFREHTTLKRGDIVTMTYIRAEFRLRTEDGQLHEVLDSNDQYVILVPVTEGCCGSCGRPLENT